jgi:DNA helicase HerA-like ATPase
MIMPINDYQSKGQTPVQQTELLGHVISVHGSQANVGLSRAAPHGPEETRATVGKFLGVRAGKSLLIGLITDVSLQPNPVLRDSDHVAVAQLELIGEIDDRETASAQFQRGVTTYPAMGDVATFIGARELRLIFQSRGSRMIDIGHLQQDSAIPARLDVDEMLSKHFAVLGTTGVGKSSAVALLLQQIVNARPDLRFFILDVHNEYGRCFGDRAQILNPSNVKLPFWLFNFDEIVDVFFGARPGLDEEVDFLSEAIPLAKSLYAQQLSSAGRLGTKSGESAAARYTLDVPVPYRIADLVAVLDARMGKLENRASRMVYHKLITRIETICNDPRYAFMFENANVGGDTMVEILATLFRLPPNGRPMTIMQLAGFPSEVVDAVVSVTCRMAFDLGLWSDGNNPMLIVCEEAHRYMAADHSIGFAPTRRAISRIAKEGRKYGVSLGLITQRPAELDPTILSQCSTLFAMRMTNDRDQALLRSAVADTAANLLAFLPSLGTGEAFAFGEGVALPTRLKFRQLPAHLLPKSETGSLGDADASAKDRLSLASVVERWRGRIAKPSNLERPIEDVKSPSLSPAAPAAPVQPPPALDPTRSRLLKRPLEQHLLNTGWDRTTEPPRR